MNLTQFDLLGKNIDKNTPFFASLVGGHRAIKRFFGFSDIALPIVQSNNVKAVLRQGLENPNDLKYPYAYMTISSLNIVKDLQATKTVRRQGQAFAYNETNSTVSKFYGFPITVDLELHFVTNDSLQAIQFALKALTLLNTETLSFDVEVDDFAWKVRISTDSESISFPPAEKDNEADPEAHDMTCSIRISGYSGVVRETSKINNAGEIKMNSVLSNGPTAGE